MGVYIITICDFKFLMVTNWDFFEEFSLQLPIVQTVGYQDVFQFRHTHYLFLIL